LNSSLKTNKACIFSKKLQLVQINLQTKTKKLLLENAYHGATYSRSSKSKDKQQVLPKNLFI